MSAPLLDLRGLTLDFDDKQILNGLDLVIEPEQSVVLIGGSGCGKSVTVKCALGLIDLDGGQVIFDGVPDNSGIELLRRRSGMLFQGGALFDSMTVWENVAFCLLYRDRMPRARARERAIETLARVRLGSSVADAFPAELSGGMKKRAAMARAIIDQPDVLFLDEPTTGLDPITAAAVDDLIVEQVRALGAAALTITHDMASVRKIADMVAMLHQGRIIWTGRVDQLDTARQQHLVQFVNGRLDGPIQPSL